MAIRCLGESTMRLRRRLLQWIIWASILPPRPMGDSRADPSPLGPIQSRSSRRIALIGMAGVNFPNTSCMSVGSAHDRLVLPSTSTTTTIIIIIKAVRWNSPESPGHSRTGSTSMGGRGGYALGHDLPASDWLIWMYTSYNSLNWGALYRSTFQADSDVCACARRASKHP